MRAPDERVIGCFQATADDGASLTVLRVERLAFDTHPNGALIPVPGPEWLELEDGHRVVEVEPGILRIAGSGRSLRSSWFGG